MPSEFITRTGGGEYQVIFKTTDKGHYIAIQNLCRQLIGHMKPDEPVRIMRCWACKHFNDHAITVHGSDVGECDTIGAMIPPDWYCADWEGKEGDDPEVEMSKAISPEKPHCEPQKEEQAP